MPAVLPSKREIVVVCKLGALQERMYKRAVATIDFWYLSLCGRHRFEQTRFYYGAPGPVWKAQHGGEMCNGCPNCLNFNVFWILMRIAVRAQPAPRRFWIDSFLVSRLLIDFS